MEKQPMSVTVATSTADVLVIKIDGEIGLSSLLGEGGQAAVGGENALDASLRSLAAEPPKVVVFDLTGASYLSSMGIGTLMRFRKRVSPGSDVRVAAGRQLVTLLKLGRLDQLLPIFPNVDAAIAG
jgi:anti-anti-sigma regulatory factor